MALRRAQVEVRRRLLTTGNSLAHHVAFSLVACLLGATGKLGPARVLMHFSGTDGES